MRYCKIILKNKIIQFPDGFRLNSVLTCFLFAKKTVIQVMITLNFIVPFLQILTSAPAVPTTATVHLLHVQTQRDPLAVHVTVLTSEMAEVAIYHQVIIPRIIRDVHSLNPYLHSLEAHYSGRGGGGGIFKQILAGYVPLAFQSRYALIVYSVTIYRLLNPSQSLLGKYVIFAIPTQSLSIFMN